MNYMIVGNGFGEREMMRERETERETVRETVRETIRGCKKRLEK